MLVLSRKTGQQLHLGDGVVLTVLGWRAGQVRLGIEAPQDMVILREEVRGDWPVAECQEQRRTMPP